MTLKVSHRKLDQLELQCYQNAIRLHLDSVLLLAEGSFPSAFALSVISTEEFGKGFAIAEISFQSRLEKGFSAEDEKTLAALLRDHRLKQGWFVAHAFGGILTPKGVLRRFQEIQSAKNDALYVGVRQGNHHIVRPFLVSKSKASVQISMVNDALIDLIKGTVAGTYGFEKVLDRFLRRRLLITTLGAVRTRINQIRKASGKDVVRLKTKLARKPAG